jgi:signal transduction histidine kinase
MISTVVTPHNSSESDSLGPATNWQTSSDEVGQLRAKCEHLSLAVAAMSHELRQGFHILLGCLSRCGTAVQSRSEQARIQDAEDLVHHLTREFDSLATLAALSSAHPGAPQLDAVAVRPILLATYERWQPEAHKKGIRIRVTLTDANVLSNAHWLDIMLSNIVGNAVRHSNSGDVSVGGDIEAPDFILAVRDSGPGIDEAEIRRAFDAVSPPRPSSHGLGLGLSIVRRAAELLGHGLSIRSTPLRGTAVCLRIPMAEATCNRDPPCQTSIGKRTGA